MHRLCFVSGKNLLIIIYDPQPEQKVINSLLVTQTNNQTSTSNQTLFRQDQML